MTAKTNFKRFLSAVTAAAMVVTVIIPLAVFAAVDPTISLDLSDAKVGQTVVFNVKTFKNDDPGTMVKGKYSINSGTAIKKIEYYETASGMEGWYDLPSIKTENEQYGEFGPSTGFPLMDAESKFRVEFAEAGTYDVTVSAVKLADGDVLCENAVTINVLADFSNLNAAIASIPADLTVYSESTAAAVQEAKEAAEALDQTSTAVSQTVVDMKTNDLVTAISGLKAAKQIGFTATAVALDVEENYGKADTVVLVFGEPTNGNADITDFVLDGTNSWGASTGVWSVDNTIYTITLTDDAAINNGAKISFNEKDDFKAELDGSVIKTVSDVDIKGNLEGADLLPYAMTATIVKGNTLPYAAAGDKVVVVLNAPNDTNIITLTYDGNDYTATAVDSYNTVFEITDVHGLIDGASLVYGAVSADLKGSFGKAIMPEIVKATISDEDGTAFTKGDKIYVFFSAETNEANTGTLDGNLAGAVYTWLNSQTLVITVGDTAIENGAVIDLECLDIMDKYEVVKVTPASKQLEGSFGTAIQPALLTLTAISKKGTGAASEGDEIYLAFNVKMREDALDLRDFTFNYGDYGTNTASVRWASGAEYSDYSTIIITLGQNPNVVPGTTKISIDMDLYEMTGTKKCDPNNLVNSIVTGTFGTSIAPSLINATVVKKVPVVGAQNGDRIVLLFNAPTNGADIASLLSVPGKSLGINYTGEWSSDNTIYTISLGSNPTIENGDEIVFTNDGSLKDINGQKTAAATSVNINGSFGNEVEAVGISPSNVVATIVKTTGSAGANAGDKIVFAFNVATNGADLADYFRLLGKFGDNPTGGWNSEKTLYTLVLDENASVVDGDVVSFTTEAGIKDVNEINSAVTLTTGKLIGSFGTTIDPESVSPSLLSAAIVKGDGNTGGTAMKGDKVVFAFNMATNKAELLDNMGGAALFGIDASGTWNDAGNMYTVVLGTNAGITDASVLKITSEAGLKDKQGYSASAVINNITLIGSFGIVVDPVALQPDLLRVDIIKASGKMGAQQGDKLRFIFNIITNKAGNEPDDNNVELLDIIQQTLGGENEKASFGNNASGGWNEQGNIYEITLGENPQLSDNVRLIIPAAAGIKDASGKSEPKEYVVSEFNGSFGASIAPKALSAVAYCEKGVDYIKVVFNVAVARLIGEDGNAIMIFQNNGNLLGKNPSGEWLSDNTYRLKLDDGFTITNNSPLKFNDSYKIYSQDGNAVMPQGQEITVTGELRKPMVTEVYAGKKIKSNDEKIEYEAAETITIVFSSRTNGKAIDLSSQSSSLGIGASASWNDSNTELTITLGADRKISVGGGYILLNGLGITNGFDNNEIVGQYSISEGKLKDDVVKVVDARVNARTDGKFMTVTFNVPTNMYNGIVGEPFDVSDIADNIESSYAFAEGAETAKWISAERLEIKLVDTADYIENGVIAFKNLRFANGLGDVAEEAVPVTGSFDGREIKLKDFSVETNGEYTTAAVSVDKQELNYTGNVIVTFVIWNSEKTTVADMNAVNVDMNAVEDIKLSSKFSAKDYSKLEVYVTDEYIDAIDGTTAFNILAETVTANKPQTSEN